MVILIAIPALSLTACSDDDDEYGNSNLNGKITFEEDGEKTTLYAYNDAQWFSGHYECLEGESIYLSKGATFSATLSKGNQHSYHFQFDAVNTIKQGAEVDVASVNCYPKGKYSSYFCEYYSGSVYVKSIKNNRITLQFKNFKFKRIKEFRVGDSSFTEVIINGEITFVNDDIEEEQDEPTPTMNVTLDGVSCSVGTSVYGRDWVDVAWAFISSLHSANENQAFLLYYENYEVNEVERGKKLDNDCIHIAFHKGAGSVSGSQVNCNYTEILGGSVSVVDYSKGVGLRFNNLRFITSSNPGHTYRLQGTIYYEFRYF